MLSLAATVLGWLLNLFGFGKPDPIKQGEALGVAETQAASYKGELDDIAKADAGRNSVDPSVDGLLRDRNNAGPDSGP